VIGEPGDEVKIENGAVFIKRPSDDFRQLDEPYVQHIDPKGAPDPDKLNDRAAQAVPARQFYVLGDNRDDSRDSRDWGFVPEEYIRGKVLLVYWSVNPDPLPSDKTPPSGPVAGFLRAFSASFSRTRWDRTFHVIR